MNQAHIVGRLVRDPELRFTGNGNPLCFITVAADRRYKNMDGEREADFVPVKTWGNVAKSVAEHLQKGRRVAVTGSMQTRLVKKQEVTYNEVVLNADYVEFLDSPNRQTAENTEPNLSSEVEEATLETQESQDVQEQEESQAQVV